MSHKLVLVLAFMLPTAFTGYAQGNTPKKSLPPNPASPPLPTQPADGAIRKVDFRNFTYRLTRCYEGNTILGSPEPFSFGLGGASGQPEGLRDSSPTGRREIDLSGTLEGCQRARLKDWWHPFRVQTD